MLRNSLIDTVFCFCLTLALFSCEKTDQEKSENLRENSTVLYSAFSPAQPREWGSVDLALQKPKMNGMIEVSKYVDQAQTAEQKKSADELYDNFVKAVHKNGWLVRENALKDGYLYEKDVDSTHYHNYPYIFDGENLNPNKPEVLMYYPSSEGTYLLAGAMFLHSDPLGHGEQIGGHEMVWHYHQYEKPYCQSFDFEKWKIKDPQEMNEMRKRLESDKCKEGFYVKRSPEMIHLWIIDHPQGRFASTMGVEEKFLYTGLNQAAANE